MANLFAGSSIPNFAPAASVAIFAFFEKVPALSSDFLDDRDNNGSLVISQWSCHVSAHRGTNEPTKVDGSFHVPVLFPATTADVRIRRNVTVGHRYWRSMRQSNERIEIVEFRRKQIQHRQVEFRGNILLREGAAGEISARGSACIGSRSHLVLDVVGVVGVSRVLLFGSEFWIYDTVIGVWQKMVVLALPANTSRTLFMCTSQNFLSGIVILW
jgi:hypothetical protein